MALRLNAGVLVLAMLAAAPAPARDFTKDPNREVTVERGLKPTMLFPLDAAEEAREWRSVDDVVMGGRSSSQLAWERPGLAVFRGHVSLENRGGFASVRSAMGAYDLEGQRGIALRVRGDGKAYKLSLRTDGRFDGVSYQARFTTAAGKWQTIRLPFAAFRPTYHGRVLGPGSPLVPSSVRSFGLLISEGQEGPFRLEIGWIGAYREERRPGPAP